MNPYMNTDLNSGPHDVAAQGSSPAPAPAPHSVPDTYVSHNPSFSSTPCPPVIQTSHSCVMVLRHNTSAGPAPSDQDQNLVPLSNSSSLLPTSGPGSNIRSWPESSPDTDLPQAPTPPTAPSSTLNPYPALAIAPTSQVSVIIPSPDLLSQWSEETCPDLECSICFSQFNNIFRCPKMLQCKHTFCLECLARINVKSAEPSAIQCPLCRGFTPLPDLGLPKLATDSNVLSCLPAAMQRVYSVRFVRNKGKLEVKRSSSGQRSLTSLRSTNHSLDVGLPSPPLGDRGAQQGGLGGALFRLTGRPACRAFLLTCVVMMILLLVGIIIFILIFKKN